jgi:hypothetical protein
MDGAHIGLGFQPNLTDVAFNILYIDRCDGLKFDEPKANGVSLSILN